MPDSGEYQRGHEAGGIAERLDSHDRHFATINGSLGDIAREMAKFTLAIQRMSDQAEAREATVLTTAAALKAAEEARRASAEQSWTPVTKIFAVLAAIATVVGAAVGVYLAVFT